MELVPHDILRISRISGIGLSDESAPNEKWIEESLEKAPFVVVRRAGWQNGKVPVGIRGPKRHNRFATFLSPVEIKERITPYHIAACRGWQENPRTKQIKALDVLHQIDEFFEPLGIIWGPTGSIGFELATRCASSVPTSDLDLIIRMDVSPPAEQTQKLLDLQKACEVRLDIQLETPLGAVSLIEYGREEQQILLRTSAGPVLVSSPWTPQKENRRTT